MEGHGDRSRACVVTRSIPSWKSRAISSMSILSYARHLASKVSTRRGDSYLSSPACFKRLASLAAREISNRRCFESLCARALPPSRANSETVSTFFMR
jgi:hypothetical protein